MSERLKGIFKRADKAIEDHPVKTMVGSLPTISGGSVMSNFKEYPWMIATGIGVLAVSLAVYALGWRKAMKQINHNSKQ